MTTDEAFRKIREGVTRRTPAKITDIDFPWAAVLVPILARPAGPAILFTQRTETVQLHKGQISFPGGRMEPGEDAREGALREAEEEVGLTRDRVEIVGPLDEQITVSRHLVAPLAGFIANPPGEWRPQATEVAVPFEVPLERLLDPKNVRRELWDASMMPADAPVKEILESRVSLEEIDPETGRYAVYFFDGGDGRIIWGLTARILKELLAVSFGFRVT